MVTDYYRNVYQQKVTHLGANLRDKGINRGKDEFERYLATTPTRQQLSRLIAPYYTTSHKIYAAIIGPSGQNLVADRYEKLILGSLDDNWAIGDIFTWSGENWIVLTQERLTIPTHFKGKVRFCNYYLKWNEQGDIYQVPGHVITSRAFALEEGQKAGLTWDEQAMVIQAILPSNEITRTISRYHRFIIKGKAWQVVSTDELSVENLLFVRLEEDQINRATDDVENEIADKYIPVPDTTETIAENVYSLDGEHTVFWNKTTNYTGYINGNIDATATFEIIETDLAIITNTTNPAIVKVNSTGLTGNFTLICRFSTGEELTKIVKVTSLWG